MQEVFDKIAEKLSNNYRNVNSDIDLEWNRAIYECAEMVKEVVAEYNNGWVPVEERLPEEHWESREIPDYGSKTEIGIVVDADDYMTSDNVLTTVRNKEKDKSFVSENNTVNGKWYCFCSGEYEVVAWQPLPEEYRD